jgi:UDP-N-acetyl-D-glucosamine dehydrogenase
MLLPKLGAGTELTVGEDWFLAFSPERVDPGRTDWTTVNTPKVIGGITQDCGEVAAAWYRQAIQTVKSVSSTEAAEMAKLLENTFRMINIGLVNEMAIMCARLGVDVWEVIEAAATKPFGYMKFTPGPGLGGHCIPIDPLYLSWKMKTVNYNARFIELASEINTNMPLCRRPPDGGVERSGQAAEGSPRARAGRGLQTGYRRHPRIAGAGCDRAAAPARRGCAIP